MLNLSPIDEHWDFACERVRLYWVQEWAFSQKPWGGHRGVHCNSASSNLPPGTFRLTKSLEILTNPLLTKSTNKGGKGRGEKLNNLLKCCLKQTTPHTAEMNNTCESRNSIFNLNVHYFLTSTYQHWVDFNLA